MWQLEDWKKSLKKIDDKFDIGAGNVWVRPQHSPTIPPPPHAYRPCREIVRSSPTPYDGAHPIAERNGIPRQVQHPVPSGQPDARARQANQGALRAIVAVYK